MELSNIMDNPDLQNRRNFYEQNSSIQVSSEGVKVSKFSLVTNKINYLLSKCYECLFFFFPQFKLFSLTFILFVLIVLVYFTQLSYYQYYKNNWNFSNAWSCSIYDLGGSYTPAIIIDNQIYRFLTSVFLHDGYSHIFGNMMSFLLCGFFIEDKINTRKFTILLILSGLLSSLLTAYIEVESLCLGFSGVIYGLYGYLLLYYIFYYRSLDERLKRLYFFYLVSFFFSFISSFNTYKEKNIGLFAHLGGLIGGIIVGLNYIDLDTITLELGLDWLARIKIIRKLILLGYVIVIIILLFLVFTIEITENKLGKMCKF